MELTRNAGETLLLRAHRAVGMAVCGVTNSLAVSFCPAAGTNKSEPLSVG